MFPQQVCCMTAASGCGGVQRAGTWKCCGVTFNLQPNQPLAVIDSYKTVTLELSSQCRAQMLHASRTVRVPGLHCRCDACATPSAATARWCVQVLYETAVSEHSCDGCAQASAQPLRRACHIQDSLLPITPVKGVSLVSKGRPTESSLLVQHNRVHFQHKQAFL